MKKVFIFLNKTILKKVLLLEGKIWVSKNFLEKLFYII